MNPEAPKNAIYIVLGEVNHLLTSMKRNVRYNHHYDVTQDPLIKNFVDLKNLLNANSDLSGIDATTYLAPFLEIIKSEETNGPITGLALSSVDKFITYGLIDLNSETSAICVQQIADSVTHARFVGTDPASDEVVLMKILHVLRSLMLSPIGINLTNSSVCEIMQSCFQICFESRLGEVLRKTAEMILVDMVQLLFARLPQFKEDLKMSSIKKLSMRGSGYDSGRQKRKKPNKVSTTKQKQQETTTTKPEQNDESSETTIKEDATETINVTSSTPADSQSAINDATKTDSDTNIERSNTTEIITNDEVSSITSRLNDEQQQQEISTTNKIIDIGNNELENTTSDNDLTDTTTNNKSNEDAQSVNTTDSTLISGESKTSTTPQPQNDDYVNPRGVRFIQDGANNSPIVPYGLPCVRELLRFLISLINSNKNTDNMIHMGLSLLIVALESGVDNVASYTSLLLYVRDDLCKNLFTLLSSERINIYSFALRASFLLFESLRSHLKLQLEYFFAKLMDIIVSESVKVTYDHKEIALDYIVQMLRIPGFPVELYLNYDCCLNCSNLFEDLTKLLSKNAFPVQGLFTTNSLSLNALLTVIDNIELENTISRTVSDNNLNIKGFLKPISSGFNVAHSFKFASTDSKLTYYSYKPRDSSRGMLRINRMQISANLPTQDELKKIKLKKKLLMQGIEQFNQSPSKGVQFLKDNNLLDANNLDDLIKFLKQTPTLDKKMIGEYISNRKNVNILNAFVKSFSFEALRVDESLRVFLETFRLPGEAPLIQIVLEHFAEHWHVSNGKQFANADAAFTLAYATIMLNVDQHNHNVKKQSTPMTVEDFKKNLSKCNGKDNFDEELLEEIYTAIKGDEIVMPSEHTGALRDNYLWKVLIRRSVTFDSQFIHAPAGSYNYDIFNIIWGQTVAALSFVYDKSLEQSIIQKSINGFKKCAQVAANYMMNDVFDNIVISLCKFTTLLAYSDSYDQLPIYFGLNSKAQLACKTVFQLTHNHGDMLRDGWKNIVDCIIQLYKAKLLPRVLLECEDFLNQTGRIYLIKEDSTQANANSQKSDTGAGLFSWFMAQDASTNKGPTPEEQEAIKNAQACVDECHIEQLVHDTKFLRVDSLVELVKALIFLSQSNELHQNDNTDAKYDEDSSVFSLEILIKVILQNRDRISCIWVTVRNHFYNIICHANEYSFFLERTVVGLLRISVRLLRREELTNEVLSSLRMLLIIKPNIIRLISRHIAFGLHELLRTNAANINSSDDWLTLFSLLQVIGAGASPPPVITQSLPTAASTSPTPQTTNPSAAAISDSDLTDSCKYQTTSFPATSKERDRLERGYTSDSELYSNTSSNNNSNTNQIGNNASSSNDVSVIQHQRNDWILVNKEDLEYMKSQQNLVNQYKIDLDEELNKHDKKAFIKCCETLSFLVRDVTHITPENFESCVHCLRTFVEACVCGDRIQKMKLNKEKENTKTRKNNKANNTKAQKASTTDSQMKHSYTYHGQIESEEDDDSLVTSYETISLQLLDLLDTLHNKAASIFISWSEEQKNSTNIEASLPTLWSKCWCPILQGIARLSCDINGEVRMHALQYLQRALLVHDLQTLSAVEWEACFNKVLFPLLAKLLENIDPQNLIRMEETRMRASTLLCKVFLQHLTTLARLSTFTALWLTILDYMDKYMKSDKSDLLRDVIPESLKNMLLVMETTGLFNQSNQDIKFSQLCIITKDRIESFLPGLWNELFKVTNKPSTPIEDQQQQQQQQPQQQVNTQTTEETIPFIPDNSEQQQQQHQLPPEIQPNPEMISQQQNLNQTNNNNNNLIVNNNITDLNRLNLSTSASNLSKFGLDVKDL